MERYCHVIDYTRVWIGVSIYCTCSYSAWLHFTVHCHTHTSVHIHVFTVRYLVAASNGRHSPSPLSSRTIRVPQLPASHSNSSQRLNRSCPLTNSTTTRLIAPAVLLITSRHGSHKHLCYCIHCCARVCWDAHVIPT
jgi:hypothetical protein